MFERTGADLGAAQQIYDKAEVLEFCSVLVSRRMMAADPYQIHQIESSNRRCMRNAPVMHYLCDPPSIPGVIAIPASSRIHISNTAAREASPEPHG